MNFSVYDICGYQVVIRGVTVEQAQRVIFELSRCESKWRAWEVGASHIFAGISLKCTRNERYYGLIVLDTEVDQC